MSNIFTNLELPVDVAINFNFVPKPLPTKAARRMEEERFVREAARAIQAWYYTTYC